jgi:Mor family transcriptional regulator
MAKRTISAREFAADVRSGMEDEDLIKKYRLSLEWVPIMLAKLVDSGVLTREDVDRRAPEVDCSELVDTGDVSDLEDTGEYEEFEKTIVIGGLDEIERMTREETRKAGTEVPSQHREKRARGKAAKKDKKKARPAAKEIASDIRSGLQDQDLMTKYNLSEKALAQVFTKLVDAGLLSTADIDARRRVATDSLLIETSDLDMPSCTANLSDFAVKLPRPPQEARQVQEIAGVETEDLRGGGITRDTADSLREFSEWWRKNKARLSREHPGEKPRFHRKKLIKLSVELSLDLVKAAEKRAIREKRITGGEFDSLIELLLWDFLDRDPRFTE